jgi:hypothetical protein
MDVKKITLPKNEIPIKEVYEVLPLDKTGEIKLGYINFVEHGPISFLKEEWDNMSKEEQDSWNKENKKRIENIMAEREKLSKELGTKEEDIIRLD